MVRSTHKLFVEGFDSLTSIYSREFSGGMFSESELITVLQRLVCQDLTRDEIVECSLRRGRKGKRNLLDPHISRDPYGISVGENPYFTARYEELPK